MPNMSRANQTTLLMILTALTLMPAYALQGWLASGHNANDLPQWFWIGETVAWSSRALIEAAALRFLFSTQASNKQQGYGLLFFEITLIALITVTLGPVVASTGTRQPLPTALAPIGFWVWSFAIASYAPLMIAAVGFAYRVQPQETSATVQDEMQLQGVIATVQDNPPLQGVIATVQDETPLQDGSATVQDNPQLQDDSPLDWETLTDEQRYYHYQQFATQDITDGEIATTIFNINPSTLSRLKKRMNGVAA